MTKKELAKKVLELEHDGEVAKFYVSSNAQKTQFMLCLVTNRPMTNDDVLQALDVFVADALDEGTDFMGPAESASEN